MSQEPWDKIYRLWRDDSVDMKPLTLFKIELLLYFTQRMGEGTKIEDACLYLAGYHIDCREDITEGGALCTYLAAWLPEYRSREKWEQDLKKYFSLELAPYRIWDRAEDGASLVVASSGAAVLSLAAREKYWKNYLRPRATVEAAKFAIKDSGEYFACVPHRAQNLLKMRLDFDVVQPSAEIYPVLKEPTRRPPLEFSLAELIATACELKNILQTRGNGEYQAFSRLADSLRAGLLKGVIGRRLEERTALTIAGVEHLIGMVGAGKTTLIKTLAVLAAKKGHRLVIVLRKVDEVFSMLTFLRALGVKASPLVGKDREKHFPKLREKGADELTELIASYMDTGCALDGCRIDSEPCTLAPGEMPCSQIIKRRINKYGKYIEEELRCPLYNYCGTTRMWRESLYAPIVLTTLAGLLDIRVTAAGTPFYDVALHNFDLVIVDECDSIQASLDDFFIESVSSDRFQSQYATPLRDWNMDAKKREEDINYDDFMVGSGKYPAIIRLLKNHLRACCDAPVWSRYYNGEAFSRPSILARLEKHFARRLESEPRLKAMLTELKDFTKAGHETLWMSAKLDEDFAEEFTAWFDAWGVKMTASDINIVRLVILLAIFHDTLNKLYDSYDSCKATEEYELLNILHSRHRHLQRYITTAYMGNAFEFRYQSDAHDIIITRQLGSGRGLVGWSTICPGGC